MKTIIRFFSSVKLAIVLIILLVAASILGTLIPQGREAAEYAARYGQLAGAFGWLQFTNVFRSAWFLGLLGLFGANIVACTLTRLSAKVRRVTKPKIESDPKELAGFKIKDKIKMSAGSAEAKRLAEEAMRGAHYRVRAVEEGGAGRIHLHGRKRIDGIFGSDVVHLGLLIVIAGGILTGLGGFRADVVINPGETKDVPRAGFAVRLDRFDTEMYPNGGVKDWKSTLTLVENGKDVRTQVVEVNRPLAHKGFSLYQMAYGSNFDAATLEFRIGKKVGAGAAAGQAAQAKEGQAAAGPAAPEMRTIKARIGETVGLGDPEMTEFLAVQFLPDFVLDENNRPATRSLELNNPAAFVEVRRGGKKVVEGWVFGAYPEVTRLRGEAAPELTIEFRDLDAPQYSVLQAAKDPGVPLVWIGCLLVMAGLFLAFYRPTWEIRMTLESGAGTAKTDIAAGGIAAKSRDRFEIEFAGVMETIKAGSRSSK